jgi:3-hydroxybutyryl-CoA dehydratase
MQTLGLGFTWEQLSPGQRFRTLNRTITETDLVLFTGVTGMLETIFIDRTFAAEKGAIQGQFVPVALTYSLIEGLLCQSIIQGTGLAMLELNKQVLTPASAASAATWTTRFRFRLANLPRLFPAVFPAPPSFHKPLT